MAKYRLTICPQYHVLDAIQDGIRLLNAQRDELGQYAVKQMDELVWKGRYPFRIVAEPFKAAELSKEFSTFSKVVDSMGEKVFVYNAKTDGNSYDIRGYISDSFLKELRCHALNFEL